MAFKDIPGNGRVKKVLQKALLKNRVPNSLLFCGPEGIGKKDVALVVAKAMNCRKKKGDACESCISCKAINKGNFPDVLVLSPVGNFLTIGQMKDLKHIAYFKPMGGKKRIFIIENAERMNEEASNSLLKILEEPPLFSHIILITKNPFMIVSTIKSRCQTLSFLPISREDIENELVVEKGYERKKARIISLIVQGNREQAMSLEWEHVQSKRKEAWGLFQSLLKKGKISSFLKNYAYKKRELIEEDLEQILEIVSSFCRDLILVKEKGDVCFMINPDYEEEIRRVEKFINFDRCMDFLSKIEHALYGLEKNINTNLLVSSTFLNLMEWENV